MVVVTRKDLTPGQQIAQVGHAVAEMAVHYTEQFKKWNSESNSIICLQAKDEPDLYKYRSILARDNAWVDFVDFSEPDLNDALTAFAFIADRDLRKKFSSLPLAGKGATHG